MTNRNKHSSQNTLRILILNKRSWKTEQPGGSERNLEESIKRLANKGHEIHLMVGAEKNQPTIEHNESITIYRIGFADKLSSPWDVISSYILISIIFYRYLYSVSPDIVYTVNDPLPWPIFTRKPRVSIYHHLAIDTFFTTHSFPQNLLGYLVQKIGVFRDRNIATITVSPSTTEELISRGHNPETVYEIKNGIDLNKYKPGKESDIPQILYIGGLAKYKGVDRIPTIHSLLTEHFGKVKLNIAGRNGPLRDGIIKYCKKTDTAKFHGYVDEKTKRTLLEKAWVYIAPSRVEGWGITVIEANACATPAVGFDVPGLRDSIIDGKTGLLTDEDNPKVFAEDVAMLLNDNKLRRQLGKNARKWAEEHSWDKTADELERVFVSINKDAHA